MSPIAESINYATTGTSLGRLLVAVSALGLCSALLGDEDAVLISTLADRFPGASIEIGDGRIERLVSQVAALVERPAGPPPRVKLDLRGTSFQLAVWAALRDIPPGRTITYRELATKVGHPRAARAVGTACGANPLPIVVPCHRVIGSDGSLGGFSAGVERKRVLLEREQSHLRLL